MEVRPGGRRRIDRVLDPGYAEELADRPLEEVRALRDEAAQEETDLSYLRRLLHGRIDIVLAEQHRRSTGGGAVVDQLAEILAPGAVGPPTGSGRHHELSPSRAEAHRRHVEALISDVDLSDVGTLAGDALEQALEAYRAEESSVSGLRKRVQQVVDRLNGEITARYQRGAANVDDILAAERTDR